MTALETMTCETAEGHPFVARAAEVGFRRAVEERDRPFGDFGPSTFKG